MELHKGCWALAAVALFGTHARAVMQFPDCVGGPEILTDNLVCVTSASPAARAEALIDAWNITEKLLNLVE